jgi:hypothetical protein
MSSIGARKQLKAALHHEQVAKSLLARFRIENAPSLKYAEARERYDRAARAYAAAGKPERCADAYGKCADMSARLSRGATAEAVEYHVRCGELSEANDPDRARDHYAEACDQCCDLGSWATAAELRHRVARLAARDAQDDEEGWSERVLLLRSAADMYGAAARRLHDETKAAKMRLCKLEAAAIEALQLKLYSRAADAFEAVATEVVQDNLTAANATRLFFKSALCSLVGGEHDLMRGKVEIFAKRDPVFGASPEKLFLVDANRCATAEGLPDYDTFADAAYNFCTVRSLDAWDLSMLKVLNDDMRVKYDAYWSRVKRRAAREKRRAQKRKEEEERQARMKRDEARFAACDYLHIFSDVAPRHRADVASMASPVA